MCSLPPACLQAASRAAHELATMQSELDALYRSGMTQEMQTR